MGNAWFWGQCVFPYPPDASSEYLSAVDLTDTDDAGRHGSLVSTVQDRTGPQVAMMGDSYAGLSPMIIMNNFVLKQVKLARKSKCQFLCVYSKMLMIWPVFKLK